MAIAITLLVAGHDAGDQATTKLLYIGTIAFATSGAFLVVLGLMLAVPALSYWPLLLLFLPDRLVALRRRRQVPATGGA